MIWLRGVEDFIFYQRAYFVQFHISSRNETVFFFRTEMRESFRYHRNDLAWREWLASAIFFLKICFGSNESKLDETSIEQWIFLNNRSIVYWDIVPFMYFLSVQWRVRGNAWTVTTDTWLKKNRCYICINDKNLFIKTGSVLTDIMVRLLVWTSFETILFGSMKCFVS